MRRPNRRGEHEDRVVGPHIHVMDAGAGGQPVVGDGALGGDQHSARGVRDLATHVRQ